jgi:hypothetical protein
MELFLASVALLEMESSRELKMEESLKALLGIVYMFAA